MYTIGTIINTHGIKGEVKIKSSTDFSERFESGNTVYLKTDEEEMELIINQSRSHKQYTIVHFKAYDSINDVEGWKGSNLYIKDDQQQELKENEYYYHEIIGCNVVTTDEMNIGKIDAILAPGANDVWVVKTEVGKEILIPYIADVVKQVDIQNKVVVIELMEGLID